MSTLKSTSKQELRKFGFTFGAILVLLFGLFFPWLLERAIPLWPWVTAGIFWLWALAAPVTLGPVYHGWMKFGAVLGWINTRIILGVVFYVIILPVGLIMRIRTDPMARRLDPEIKSYRVPSKKPAADSMEKPF